MKKLFCDICGKEIYEGREFYAKIELGGVVINYDKDAVTEEKQICGKCYKRIFGEEKNG